MIIIIFVITLICTVYEIIENNVVDVEYFEVTEEKIKGDFEGLKIAHISDLHLSRNKVFIDDLINIIKESKVDLIFLTGDLVDRRSNIETSALDKFCERISKIAPCYAVSGNHDIANNFERWNEILKENNIKVLDGQIEVFEKDGNKFALLGIRCWKYYSNYQFEHIEGIENMTTILLAHKPDQYFDFFSKGNSIIPDYAFSGHAHGGQVRIPFIKQGILSPNQGLFPNYTSGIYEEKILEGTMVVSRGLGNSSCPIRVNNRVHLPIVTIKK